MFKLLFIITAFIALPLATAQATEIPSGKTLFAKNCATCHAADGSVSAFGKKLKPFPARDLRAIAKDVSFDELRRIVTHGTHKSKMKAMKYKLTPLEIENVVDYIKTFTYKPNLANGKMRFKAVCASCHGFDGRAKTGMGAKNLVYSKLTLEEKFHTIRYGRPGTLMQAKRHQLSNTDIADIANYVESLKRHGSSMKGKKLYAINCKQCHVSPASIKIIGNAASKKTLAKLSDLSIDLRIRHGRHVNRAGKGVSSLSSDKIQDIIAYLRQQTK